MLAPSKNVSLLPYSGMATPAKANHFVAVATIEQLQDAIVFAAQRGLAYLVLGEGSNTVFIDDYQGLVVVNQLRGITLADEDEYSVTLEVAAGENWHALVAHTLTQGWYGLENLALIPGSVGAAPVQNIGAYGVELKSCIESVDYLDPKSHCIHRLTNQQCQFAYRDSIFKNELSGAAVITSVRLRLKKEPAVNLSYRALSEFIGEQQATPQQVFSAVCEIRRAKLPLPSDLPNCGSFFKNPVVSREQFKRLQAKHPEIVGFSAHGGVKLAAAWLIEQGGWKQKSQQGVRVHQQQALVITNPRKAHGAAVASYAAAIQRDVLHRYGVTLEIEPRIY